MAGQGPVLIPHSRPLVGTEELSAVRDQLESAWVGSGGDSAQRLREALCALCGVPGVGLLGSGTSAIELAIRALVAEGCIVGVPAFACASIVRGVVRAGCRPLEFDVDPDDLSIRSADVIDGGKCDVLLVVHQFGLPSVAAVHAAQASVPVIEDITTVIGGSINGHIVGSFGECAVLSFGATKLVTAGEGGAVLGAKELVDIVASWADPESDLSESLPVAHSAMSALSCAVARIQIGRLPAMIERRAAIAAYYSDVLAGSGLGPVRPREGTQGTWWRYLVKLPYQGAEAAVTFGEANGVALRRPVSRRAWLGSGKFPTSDRLASSLISVPIYPGLSDSEVELVGAVLRSVAVTRR